MNKTVDVQNDIEFTAFADDCKYLDYCRIEILERFPIK